MKYLKAVIKTLSSSITPFVEHGKFFILTGENISELIHAELVSEKEVKEIAEEISKNKTCSLEGKELGKISKIQKVCNVEYKEGFVAFASLCEDLDRTEFAIFSSQEEAEEYLQAVYPELF